MRNFITLILLLNLVSVKSQDVETTAVENCIKMFFEGFHEQDSLKLMSVVSSQITMKTIGNNKESGKSELREVSFEKFLTAILGIPDSVRFQEKILAYTIKIDDEMAHAWTPYEFWYNHSFSHCGVNSFQLFKENGKWQIISILDTRRKEPCPME